MITIVVDFDGTCVKHEFPKVGAEIGAAPILKELVEAGNNLVLFTMRSGQYLEDAVNWFKKHEIPLYGVQTNPTQNQWTSSPKAYGNLFIDDAALGAPLIMHSPADKPFINWLEVRRYFIEKGIIENKTIMEEVSVQIDQLYVDDLVFSFDYKVYVAGEIKADSSHTGDVPEEVDMASFEQSLRNGKAVELALANLTL